MSKLKSRAAGGRRTLGALVLVWNVWRRLPAKQRKQVLALARKHGPRLARKAYKARRARR